MNCIKQVDIDTGLAMTNDFAAVWFKEGETY